MIGSEGAQNVNQNLPFSISPDEIDAEVGYLNGSKVTVKAVGSENIVGIQVSENMFEDIPKNTRPVKISFKDFRNWLRKCRPVKALEHLLMGRGKRKLLKQNWVPISQAKADEVLKDVGSQEEKEELSGKIKEFNTGLSSLAQKKLDYAKLRLENDEFKAKYKTILAIADGKLNSSYKLPKNLVVALPPADEGGNPQYILIDSGSYRVRKDAANELAKIFRESSAYHQFNLSKDRVNRIKQEREEIKKLLKKHAGELKEMHKNFIETKMEDDRVVFRDEIDRQRQEAIDEIKRCEKQYTDFTDGKLKENADKIDSYVDKVNELKEEIQDCENELSQCIFQLSESDKGLSLAEHIDSDLSSETSPMVLNRDGISELRARRDDLRTKVDNLQFDLDKLNDQLSTAQKELDSLEEEKIILQIRKAEIPVVTGQDIENENKRLSNVLAENDKKLIGGKSRGIAAVAKMVSGSHKKAKAVKPTGSIEPDDENQESV